MCNATRVTIGCLFCNGGMTFAQSTGLYHCSNCSEHTMRHTDQQIALWVDSKYHFSMPQPLPLGLRKPLGRPCLYCDGDMIQTRERYHWMCNLDFRHRLYYWPEWTFAQWDESSFSATRFEKPAPWAYGWGDENAATSK